MSPDYCNSTLAPESRFKPFFEKNGLDFQNSAMFMCAAGQLRELVMAGGVRQSHVARLNRLFPQGQVQIENIYSDCLKCSKRKYDYAVFNFKNQNKKVRAIFIRNPDELNVNELKELGIKTEQDKEHFHSSINPSLRGVWFVSADSAGTRGLQPTASAKPTTTARLNRSEKSKIE